MRVYIPAKNTGNGDSPHFARVEIQTPKDELLIQLEIFADIARVKSVQEIRIDGFPASWGGSFYDHENSLEAPSLCIMRSGMTEFYFEDRVSSENGTRIQTEPLDPVDFIEQTRRGLKEGLEKMILMSLAQAHYMQESGAVTNFMEMINSDHQDCCDAEQMQKIQAPRG